MKQKKQKKQTQFRERPRKNTPLLFLMLILIPLYGGYYNFTVFLSGTALVLLLWYEVRRRGALRLPMGREAVALYALCGAHLLSVPFAVSAGMAFSGFLRVATWVLFFLYASTYTQAERASILNAVAYEGAVLSLLTVLIYLYDVLSGGENANGRIDGPFQYANTWSLYLLICLIILFTREEKKWYDWAAVALILLGVFLSGSRGVFLLLLAVSLVGGAWYVIKKKRTLSAMSFG